ERGHVGWTGRLGAAGQRRALLRAARGPGTEPCRAYGRDSVGGAFPVFRDLTGGPKSDVARHPRQRSASSGRFAVVKSPKKPPGFWEGSITRAPMPASVIRWRRTWGGSAFAPRRPGRVTW